MTAPGARISTSVEDRGDGVSQIPYRNQIELENPPLSIRRCSHWATITSWPPRCRPLRPSSRTHIQSSKNTQISPDWSADSGEGRGWGKGAGGEGGGPGRVWVSQSSSEPAIPTYYHDMATLMSTPNKYQEQEMDPYDATLLWVCLETTLCSPLHVFVWRVAHAYIVSDSHGRDKPAVIKTFSG